MITKDYIIKTQMAKFPEARENESEISIYGLNSVNVSVNILDDEEKAFAYIRDNLWLEIFDGAGASTATLLLQLYISSGQAMFDILTYLYLTYNETATSGVEPTYDILKQEIKAWLENAPDAEIASALSYAMINFYMNWDERNAGEIAQLIDNAQLGFNQEAVIPGMDDNDVAKYNGCLRTGSIYWLRTNEQIGASEAFPETPVHECKHETNWLLIAAACACGFLLSKLTGGKKQ